MRTLTFLGLLLLLTTARVVAQDGTPDPSFGLNGTTIINNAPYTTKCSDFFQTKNGYILALQTNEDNRIMKLTTDGKVDSSFGIAGVVRIPKVVNQLFGNLVAVLQYGSKIITAHTWLYDIIVSRWNENGSLDSSFGNNGKTAISFTETVPQPMDIEIDSRNRVVVCVGMHRYISPFDQFAGIVRLLPDGEIDPTFGNQGNVIISEGRDFLTPYDITIDQHDGIGMVCNAGSLSGTGRFGIWLLNPNGTYNTDFNGTGYKVLCFGTRSDANGLALQSDGKVVVVLEVGGDPRGSFVIARFMPDGALDSGFGDGGLVARFNNEYRNVPYAVLLTETNSIIVGGFSQTPPSGQTDLVIMKLNPDGTSDPYFGNDGIMYYSNTEAEEAILSLIIQEDKKLLAGGFARFYSGSNLKTKPVVMRLQHGTPMAVLEDGIHVPAVFAVEQNYPNPFNPSTVIGFSLPARSRTEIAVYDIIGTEILRTVAEYDAGHHEFTFDGSALPSGVYFYRITAVGRQETRKMVFLK